MLFATSTVQNHSQILHLFPSFKYTLLNFSMLSSQKKNHVKNFHPRKVSRNISPLRALSEDCTLNGFIKDPESRLLSTCNIHSHYISWSIDIMQFIGQYHWPKAETEVWFQPSGNLLSRLMHMPFISKDLVSASSVKSELGGLVLPTLKNHYAV